MFCDTADEKQYEKSRIQTGQIFLKQAAYDSNAAPSAWQKAALDDFAACAGDEAFPCLFARKAWKAGSVRFLFAECLEDREYDDVLVGLKDYTDFVRGVDLEDRLLAPLVIFFEASALDGLSPHALGWDVLNWLHGMDPAPWPQAVPMSPDNSNWCFCFNGVQLFINMSTPDHIALRSRNLGRYLTFIVNPRENFDAVASVQTRSGRLVRETIRTRVAAYNQGAVPTELGFYGEDDNREWKQYQLEEAGLDRPAECPFKPLQSRRAPSRPISRDETLIDHDSSHPLETKYV